MRTIYTRTSRAGEVSVHETLTIETPDPAVTEHTIMVDVVVDKESLAEAAAAVRAAASGE